METEHPCGARTEMRNGLASESGSGGKREGAATPGGVLHRQPLPPLASRGQAEVGQPVPRTENQSPVHPGAHTQAPAPSPWAGLQGTA